MFGLVSKKYLEEYEQLQANLRRNIHQAINANHEICIKAIDELKESRDGIRHSLEVLKQSQESLQKSVTENINNCFELLKLRAEQLEGVKEGIRETINQFNSLIDNRMRVSDPYYEDDDGHSISLVKELNTFREQIRKVRQGEIEYDGAIVNIGKRFSELYERVAKIETTSNLEPAPHWSSIQDVPDFISKDEMQDYFRGYDYKMRQMKGEITKLKKQIGAKK